jgi:glycosyltransferase involved in cell wall biosynthesis
VKFLFIHHNFPGQYLHIVRHLVAEDRHEIIFLTEDNPNLMRGVRKIVRPKPRGPSANGHPDLRELEVALQRAEIVAGGCGSLKALGFVPDVVIGHHGWGELLNIRDVWPGVPMIGYFEFFYHTAGVDVGFDPEFALSPQLIPGVRVKNAINLLALNVGGHGQTPTRFQLETYPDWAQQKIILLPEGADLAVTRPNPAIRGKAFVIGDIRISARRKVLTYVARDLEPYRGFHIFMRALPRLLDERADLEVIIIGQDGVSYGAKLAEGNWREHMLRELGEKLDLKRVHFMGRVDYEDYLRALQRSDTHVYLTYPFVASWSLREALASGCMLVASDTAPVRDFVTHNKNGLLTPCLDPDKLAETILGSLDDSPKTRRLRAGARAYAERYLDMAQHIKAFEAAIARAIAQP